MVLSLELRRRFFSPEVLLIAMLLTLGFGLTILFGLRVSLDVSTHQLDGVYQTASGLYRLEDGQWPGKDFYPYLGIGLLYFVYPFFKLAGGDLAASVFATHVLTVWAYCFSIGVIASFLSPPSKRFLYGVLAAGTALIIMLWFYDYQDFSRVFYGQFIPGNSLRPLRAFLPYLSSTLIYLVLRSNLRPMATYSLIGVLAGLCFMWSNDYAIPTLGLMIIFAFIWAYKTGVLSWRLAGAILFCAVLTAGLTLFVATQGHPLALLKYNFLDVRLDQYWYFGPWTAQSRILTLADIITKLVPGFGWWSMVFLVFAVLTCFRPKLEYALLLLIALALIGGGSLSSLGGHRAFGYQRAFIFWCQVIAVFGSMMFLCRAGQFLMRKWRPLSSWQPPVISYVSGLVVILLGSFVFVHMFQDYTSEKRLAETDPDRFYVKELGGYLPAQWRDYVMEARRLKNVPVIEEYWGLWSAITRQHVPVPVDSVLHALGKTRHVFSNVLRAGPDLITTTKYSASEWQSWSVSTNYWFYQFLFEHYEPIEESPETLVWHKKKPQDMPETPCSITEKKNEFILNLENPGYYEIDLTLNISKTPRSLLLVRNNINYAGGVHGYFSLNPQSQKHVFPVAAMKKGINKFDFKIISGSPQKFSLSILQCKARRITLNHPEVLPFFSNEAIGAIAKTPYNITDIYWVKGVATRHTALFIPYSLANHKEFLSGQRVRFVNGEVRKIARIEMLIPALVVFLDGPLLDGDVVGYPHKFEVIE